MVSRNPHPEKEAFFLSKVWVVIWVQSYRTMVLVIRKEIFILSVACYGVASMGADAVVVRHRADQTRKPTTMTSHSAFRPHLWTPPDDAAAINRLPALTASLEGRLHAVAARFGRVKLASSLAVEDMVVTDAIVRLNLPFTVFTLNTGLLNAETLALLTQAQKRWGITITEYVPDTLAAAAFVQAHGPLAFYDSVALRRECCHIRKIAPLNRALANADAWLTGQRREQSATRTALAFEEVDTTRHIAKFNPLFDWHETDVWAYAEAYDVPVNALYHQGYPSIGCEPCTRPVKEGEDIRAGRWWWENRDSKECGLHK